MIDHRRHSRYRGASTCIAAIVKSVWTMQRRWPLSGSTKPEILDVLGVAAATQTTCWRLISADKEKKKDRSVTIHFYDIAIRMVGSFDEDDRLLATYTKLLRWRRHPFLQQSRRDSDRENAARFSLTVSHDIIEYI